MILFYKDWKKHSLTIDISADFHLWGLPFSIFIWNCIIGHPENVDTPLENDEHDSKTWDFVFRILCIGISIEYWNWEKKK